MRVYLLVAIPALLGISSCEKKDVPFQTIEANTFSCLIDGAEFSPQLPVTILSTNKPLRAYRTGKSGFVLQAQNSLNKLEIYVATTQGSGTYPLGYAKVPIPYASNPESYGSYTRYKPLGPNDDPYNPPVPLRFYTTATNLGSVTFTRLDTVARLAGGTFEYITQDAASNQQARITKGRFNVTF